MLYRDVQDKVDPAMKLVTKLLDEREAVWTDSQKKVTSERIREKLKKAGNLNNMLMKLLKDCKTWNGPVTSSNELINILKTHPCQQRFILRTELAYFMHTHKTEHKGPIGSSKIVSVMKKNWKTFAFYFQMKNRQQQ